MGTKALKRQADDDRKRKVARLILEAFPLGEAAQAGSRIDSAEWPLVMQTALENGLAPLTYAALKKLDRLGEPPAGIAKSLHAAYYWTSIDNWLRLEKLGGLLDQFERAQIPVILLKGCALAVTLYPDVGLRPMADLDLLVPADATERACALLRENGFSPKLWLTDHFSWDLWNVRSMRRGRRRPMIVEVHRHLLHLPYYRHQMPVDWFWQRTVSVPLGPRTGQTLVPTAHLVHLAAHFALHHQAGRLIWSYDLALLLARHREVIRWDEVLKAAEEFQLGEVLRVSLEGVTTLWGVCVPHGALEGSRTLQPSREQRLLFMAATAPHHDLRAFFDGWSVPGLLPKLEFYLRQLLPSPSYMRGRYGISSSWLLPGAYIARLGKGLYLAARSAVSMLRAR